jgi:hypothetical protein
MEESGRGRGRSGLVARGLPAAAMSARLGLPGELIL